MNFERSLLTESVVSILRGVNDEITYQGLAKRAETTVERTKAVLASARRILANEKIEFGVIVGEGLKRLVEIDKAHALPAVQKRLGRAAGRLEKKAARINLDKLPPAEARMVTTARTVASVIKRHAFAKPDEPEANPVEPPSTDTSKIVKLGRKA
jgi:hypothetical protein